MAEKRKPIRSYRRSIKRAFGLGDSSENGLSRSEGLFRYERKIEKHPGFNMKYGSISRELTNEEKKKFSSERRAKERGR